MSTALKYTVLAGDSFSKIASGIADSAGITYQQIEAANPGTPASGLQLGQLITIPSVASSGIGIKYTIMSGDSYSKIATELDSCHGLTTANLETANPDTSPLSLQIGEVINVPSTTQVSSPLPEVSAKYMSYWLWTYSSGKPLPGATIGIAFSGWANVKTALADSAGKMNQLAGKKFLCIGGGNNNGAFTASVLTLLDGAINSGELAGYDSVAYDVEVGDSGLKDTFSASFAAAKAMGLEVLVTISHSAPYGISDRSELMTSFFTNEDINYLSPQLYTTGSETENDYDTTGGVTWSLYANAKPAIIPSLVSASYYNDPENIGKNAVDYFEQKGVTIEGYVQWTQV